MAISNATRLSDFGSGIGTQGAILQVDNVTQRVGIGTTNPQFTLDVKGTLNATTLGITNINVSGIASIGAGVTVYGAGIVSATSYRGDGSSLTGIAVTDNISTNSISVSGIATAQDVKVSAAITALTGRFGIADGTSDPSVTINSSGINLAQGIVTATSFDGDGSALSGVSGFGTAMNSTQNTLGNLIYKTPRSYHAVGVTSTHVVAGATSGNIAFTRLDEIRLGTGATMHIGAGTTMIMNVLNLF